MLPAPRLKAKSQKPSRRRNTGTSTVLHPVGCNSVPSRRQARNMKMKSKLVLIKRHYKVPMILLPIFALFCTTFQKPTWKFNPGIYIDKYDYNNMTHETIDWFKINNSYIQYFFANTSKPDSMYCYIIAKGKWSKDSNGLTISEIQMKQLLDAQNFKSEWGTWGKASDVVINRDGPHWKILDTMIISLIDSSTHLKYNIRDTKLRYYGQTSSILKRFKLKRYKE
jgi:hypothetical protein